MTTTDASDRTFLSYLKEISQSYTTLPKQLRLRVEKWVEKLSQTGSNPTWKKHRNSYARLLLNVVLSKQLTEPFNVNPPDGPLPTFPSHLRCRLKDLLGAHESSFWRDTFSQVSGNNLRNNHNGTPSFKANDSPSRGASSVTSREIQDLNLLVKEQSRRIELLEQQLHDERLQHELHMQRQQFAHRVELERIRKHMQNAGGGGAARGQADASLIGNHSSNMNTTNVSSSFVGGSSSMQRDSIDGASTLIGSRSVIGMEAGAGAGATGGSSRVRPTNISSLDASYSTAQQLRASFEGEGQRVGDVSHAQPHRRATYDSSMEHMTTQRAMHSAPASRAGPGPNSPPRKMPPPIPAFSYIQQKLASVPAAATASASATAVPAQTDAEAEYQKENLSGGNEMDHGSSSSSSGAQARSSNTSGGGSARSSFDRGSGRHSLAGSRGSSKAGSGDEASTSGSRSGSSATSTTANNSQRGTGGGKIAGDGDDFLEYIERFQKEVRGLQAPSPQCAAANSSTVH